MEGGREGELGRERRLVGPGETQRDHGEERGIVGLGDTQGAWGGASGRTREPQKMWEELWKKEGDWEKHGEEAGARPGCRTPETCR